MRDASNPHFSKRSAFPIGTGARKELTGPSASKTIGLLGADGPQVTLGGMLQGGFSLGGDGAARKCAVDSVEGVRA